MERVASYIMTDAAPNLAGTSNKTPDCRAKRNGQSGERPALISQVHIGAIGLDVGDQLARDQRKS